MATGTVTTPNAVVECPSTTWTLVADGATYSAVGLQTAGSVSIAVAASAPADSVLGGGPLLNSDSPTVTLTLDSGDKVYGRGTGGTGYVRVYRIAR